MLNDLQLPPVDSVRSFLAFVEFMRSPKEVEALSRRLLDAMEKHADSQKALIDATTKLNELKQETETAVAVLQQKSTEAIAAAQADYDRRTAERENALAAREKRAGDLLVKVQADAEVAARGKAEIARRLKALEGAA